jgi:hypothetical protein
VIGAARRPANVGNDKLSPARIGAGTAMQRTCHGQRTSRAWSHGGDIAKRRWRDELPARNGLGVP